MDRSGWSLGCLVALAALGGCAQGQTPHSFSGGDGPNRPPRDGQAQAMPDSFSPPPDSFSPPPDSGFPPDASVPPPDAMLPPDGPIMTGVCGLAPVIPITIPFDITMTTSGGTDFFHVVGSSGDVTTNCLDGDGVGSPDRVFQFTLPTPRNITITTGNPGTNFPVILYIRDADCRTYDGCDNQLSTSNSPALLIGNPAPPGTYFLIVDGFNASGTFHLTIR